MSWKVSDREVTVELGEWRGIIQPTLPSAGIELSHGDWIDETWRIVALNPNPRHTAAIEERYLRGSDYIVRYKQSEKDRFAFQLDWRAIPAEIESNFEFGVELWISVQTSLLDCHPTLELTSEIIGATWEVIPHARLAGLSKSGTPVNASTMEAPAALVARTDSGTVVQLIYPGDQAQVQYQEVKRKSVRAYKLFGQFMEKGVIRRARIRLLATIEEVNEQMLVDSYSQFSRSPLPLTT